MADRGIGIPDGERDTVFTAFHRAAGSDGYPGTGLVLAIVHRIVQRHGGRIWAEAEVGRGASFFFTLTADAAPDEAGDR